MKKRGVREQKPWVTALIQVYLVLFALSIIVPLIWTFYTAFKTNTEFYINPWALPAKLHFENFVRAWNSVHIGAYFLNSLKLTIASVLALDIIGSMVAFACTRLRVKAGPTIATIFMAGLFIPTILCVVPMFLQLRRLNLLDSHLGLFFMYIAIQLPFTCYVLNGFFKTLPHEIEEAAIIDGCGYFRIYWNVMLPLAKPGIATVTIFNFLGSWNEYVISRTVILTPAKSTLAVGMVSLMQSSRHNADWSALFAGLVIVMIPTFIIYVIFQKYITSGMTAGAIKG